MILHHYPNSPFAEKIRLIFGFKSAHWASVIIPNVMPKPDVTALTGGYRKTPILQVGADVFCDTALIADVIEAQHPSPSLYPPGVAAASRILAQWADSTLFWTMIPYTMQPEGFAHLFAGVAPENIKAFGEDRKIFRANVPRMQAPEAQASFTIYLQRLNDMLGEQPYFFGELASIADFSVYHNLWFVLRGGPVARILDPFVALGAFRNRMQAIGHGTAEHLSSSEALRIARQSAPAPSAGISGDTHGFALGDKVVIAATDTGVDPVEGTLYAATSARLSIARTDPKAGEVVVHFPRLGFEMRRAK